MMATANLVSNFTALWYKAIAEKRDNATRYGCELLLKFLEKHRENQELVGELLARVDPERLDSLNLLCLLAGTTGIETGLETTRERLIVSLSGMLAGREDRESILCDL